MCTMWNIVAYHPGGLMFLSSNCTNTLTPGCLSCTIHSADNFVCFCFCLFVCFVCLFVCFCDQNFCLRTLWLALSSLSVCLSVCLAQTEESKMRLYKCSRIRIRTPNLSVSHPSVLSSFSRIYYFFFFNMPCVDALVFPCLAFC